MSPFITKHSLQKQGIHSHVSMSLFRFICSVPLMDSQEVYKHVEGHPEWWCICHYYTEKPYVYHTEAL